MILIIIGVTYFSFRQCQRKRGSRIILIFRILLFLVIGLLFVKPVIKWDKEILIQPTVELWIDNSESLIQNEDFGREKQITTLKKLVEKFNRGNIETKTISFDNKTKEIKELSQLTFDGKSTNLGQLFAKQSNTAILISDGYFNSGENPYTMNRKFKYPVHCIGIGDTIQKFDSKIINMKLPGKIKQGEEFNIVGEVELSPELSEQQLVLMQDGIIVGKQKINPGTQDFIHKVEFNLVAGDPGEKIYSLFLENDNDKNIHNNKMLRKTKVFHGRQKILIICSAPSFETRALKYIFDTHDDFETDIVYLKGNQWFPSIRGRFQTTDLVIFTDFPSKNISTTAMSEMKAEIGNKISAIIYLGRTNDINLLNEYFGRNIVTGFNYKNLSVITKENEIFAGHPVIRDMKNKIAWEKLPPIYNNFHKIRLNRDLQPILKTSQKQFNPLLAIGENLSLALFIGEGFWRWQFMTENKNYSQLLFNISNFLLGKDNRSNLITNINKDIFLSGETLNISSLVFDVNGLTVPTANVEVQITKQSKILDKFFMNWSGAEFTGHYSFSEAGEYSIIIKSTKDNQLIEEDTIDVIVDDRVLEFLEKGQNQALLQYIADESNGRLIGYNEIDEIISTITDKPTIKIDCREIKSINSKLIFGLLIVLLVCEWGIRKYLGYL